MTDFVVPGNKPELVLKYKKIFDSFNVDYDLYAPGFISQGGDITACGKVAGNRWHAIVGSAIYKSDDFAESAKSLTRQILI